MQFKKKMYAKTCLSKEKNTKDQIYYVQYYKERQRKDWNFNWNSVISDKLYKLDLLIVIDFSIKRLL